MSLSIYSLSAVAILILSSLCLEFTEPSQEIITECIAWWLVFVCGKIFFYFLSENSRPSNKSKLGTIAFGVVLLCLSCSIQQMIWSMVPLLVPALSLIQRSGVSRREDLDDNHQGPARRERGKYVLLCLYATVTIIALFQNDNFYGFHLKICWLFAQIVFYWGLSYRISLSPSTKSEIVTDALSTATELASCLAVIMPPLAVLWWHNVSSVPLIGMVSILKACRWVVVLILAHDHGLFVTAWTTIFAVSTNAIWAHPYGWQTSITVVAALAALYQITKTLPRSFLGKWTILAFSLCPLWAFGAHIDFTRMSTLSLRQPWTSSHHPIYYLAEEARARVKKTQLQQSQSLTDAVAEYRRRYDRAPPPGFNEWYKFAIENDVQWVDEYDLLTRSFEPFWQISPKILREYVNQALAEVDVNFNVLEVKDHRATLRGGSFQHAQLVELLQPVQHMLPDLKAVLNELDEPRILIPHDVLHGKTLHHDETMNTEAPPIHFTAGGKQVIWSSVTLSCPPDSLARSATIELLKPSDLWPPFISNLSESQDICLWPATNSRKHGFLASPSSFKHTQYLVPVLSTAKFSTFQDIMMPSSYYFQSDVTYYDESKDIPWEEKRDVVYWRGSGTGGHWTRGSWRMGHRQRFVNFTNTPSAGVEILLSKESSPGNWVLYNSTMSQVLSKFDVKFSKFFQCEPADCTDEESYFNKAQVDSNNDANQYKILYNLDGNSFSGRYYRFLKSNSLVFMQAIFKEWHDDRLIPWVHFVPISLSMEELPEITRYLLDDHEGKLIAAQIATDGRDWSRRVLRRVDLTAAWYRVFLEYARLLDDNRDALS